MHFCLLLRGSGSVPRSPTSLKPGELSSSSGGPCDAGYDSYSLSSNDSLPLQQSLKHNLQVTIWQLTITCLSIFISSLLWWHNNHRWLMTVYFIYDTVIYIINDVHPFIAHIIIYLNVYGTFKLPQHFLICSLIILCSSVFMKQKRNKLKFLVESWRTAMLLQ